MRNLKLIPLTAILLFSFSAINAQHKKREREKEAEEKDNPSEYNKQAFEMEKDPALGYVPYQRLLKAIEHTAELKAAARNARNSPTPNIQSSPLTWIERGPIYDSVGPSNGNGRGGGTGSTVGGYTSGRIRAFLLDTLNDPTGNTAFTGGVGGGLWKCTNFLSTDVNWAPIDDRFNNLAISSIAQDPTNPQIIYFSTGEPADNADRVVGAGVWKSINGGISFTWLPSTANYMRCFKIGCDAAGNVYLANRTTTIPVNQQTGLVRSTDGGVTWTDITPNNLDPNSSNSCTDFEFTTSGILNAMFGYRPAGNVVNHRYTTNPSTVTPGTWSSSTGFRTSNAAAIRTEMAVLGNILYAVTINPAYNTDSCYKSVDGGITWTKQNTTVLPNGLGNGQGWYSISLAINPTNSAELISGGLDAYRSSNSGATWTKFTNWVSTLPYVHADHHYAQYWIAGGQTRMIMCTDGGIFYTSDNGTTFTSKNKNLGIKQFYSAAIHPTAGSNYLLAGAQDNGVHQLKNPGLSYSTEVTGGDGMIVHINQLNPLIQFGSYVYNQYRRTTNGGATWSSVNLSAAQGLFVNPFDNDDAQNIMYCSNGPLGNMRRWTGNTAGSTNTTITIGALGAANSITSVKVSPYTANRIFIGSSAGKVFRIENANTITSATSAANTFDISGGSFPSGTIVCVNTGTDDNNLVATYSNYGINNVWITTDGGANWSAIDGDLPDMPVRWALFEPGSNQKIYLATEAGIYTTTNINGASTQWLPETTFPTVSTYMLKLRASDSTIVAGTHGRGLWTARILNCIPGTIVTQPTNAAACNGSDASFTVVTAGDIISYQWQLSTNGGVVFNDIPGANSPTLNLTGVTTGMNGYQYHCVITPTCAFVLTTNNVTLTVNPNPVVNPVTSQSFCNGTVVPTGTFNFSSPTPAFNGKILMAYADNTGSPTQLRNNLLALPGVTQVDLFDASAGTPSLAQMQQYSIVVPFSNSAYADPVALGNNLADYVDANGIVVGLGFTFYISPYGPTGRWVTGNYSPYTATSNLDFNPHTLGSFTAGHPLMTGVTVLSSNFHNIVPVAAGATQVAQWDNGESLIAFKGRVVGITAYIGSSATWSGDFAKVIVNAGNWLGGGTLVFNWTNNNVTIGLGASGTGTSLPTFTATNAGTAPVTATISVTASYTNAGVTCTGPATTFTITVKPTPNTVATPSSQTICSGSAITTIVLTGNVAGTVFNWTRDNTVAVTGIAASGAGNISGSLTNTTFAPVTVTFTITPTANGCSGTPVTATVLVNPTPNAVATPASQTVCSALPITTIVLSGSVAGTTFNWTRNNTATATGIAASGTGNISGTLTNITNAPVTVTFTITPTANGCAGAAITATVLVNPTPNVSAAPSSQTICSGSAITPIVLSSTTTGGDAFVNGGFETGTFAPWVILGSNPVPVVNGTAPHTGTKAAFLGNLPGPEPLGDASIYQQITVPVSGGTLSYWYQPFTTDGITFDWQDAYITNTSGTILATIMHVCNTSAYTQVNFNMAPYAGQTVRVEFLVHQDGFGDVTNMYVDDVTLLTPAVITYNWTRDNNATVTGIAASGSGTPITGTLTNTTFAPVTVTFTITPTSNGCIGTPATATVLVNPTPNAIATPSSQTICSGTAITPIVLTSSVTGTTYAWTRNNTATVTGIAASGTGNISGTLTNTTTAPVTVTFTITPTANGCAGPPITATVIVQAPLLITCPGNITVPSIVGGCTAIVTYAPVVTGTPAPTFTYTLTGATTGSGSGTGSGLAFNVGVTTVTITATNICSTVSCSFTITVTDSQLPVVTTPPANTTVCVGSSATFSVVATNTLSYQWQAWNGSTWNNIAGATASTLTLNGVTFSMNTNSYRVIVTGLCSSVASNFATLYVNQLPTVSILASRPPVLLPTQTLTLTAVVSPGGGSYQWFKNGVAIVGATGSTLSGLTVDDVGTYTVRYTDVNGCVQTSAGMTVSSATSGNIYLYPNPNTGHFQVRFNNAPNEKVTVNIYDEKGSLVYRQAAVTTISYTSIQIDISNLPSSTYVVTVIGEDGRLIGARRVVVGR